MPLEIKRFFNSYTLIFPRYAVKNLHKSLGSNIWCFFPQNLIANIKTPLFLLQPMMPGRSKIVWFHHILIPMVIGRTTERILHFVILHRSNFFKISGIMATYFTINTVFYGITPKTSDLCATQENTTWVLKKLAEANPGIMVNIEDICATTSSDNDNGTLVTGGTCF